MQRSKTYAAAVTYASIGGGGGGSPTGVPPRETSGWCKGSRSCFSLPNVAIVKYLPGGWNGARQ